MAAAERARQSAYAPYSGFEVGAALLDAEGRIHTAANVENASYPLATCAERVAVVTAVGQGAREFDAIAVAGPRSGQPCPPCGSCRQILHEFGADMMVVLAISGGGHRVVPLAELLPEAFDASQIGPSRGGAK